MELYFSKNINFDVDGSASSLSGDSKEFEVQPARQLPAEGGECDRCLHTAQWDLPPPVRLHLQLPEIHSRPHGEHHEESGPEIQPACQTFSQPSFPPEERAEAGQWRLHHVWGLCLIFVFTCRKYFIPGDGSKECQKLNKSRHQLSTRCLAIK